MEIPFPIDDLTLIADGSADLGVQLTNLATSAADRLAIWDHQVAAVARANTGAGAETAVLVTSSTGAGGLLGLARRELLGVRVEAVQSTLRDLDDLAGNATRVLAAADALADAWSEEVELYVGLPYAPRWDRAADAVEAAGHRAAIASGPAPGPLIAQLSGLIERDCPFTVQWTNGGPSLWGVVAAVAALIDDASPAEAERQLRTGPQHWDDPALARIRRRLIRVGRVLAAADAR